MDEGTARTLLERLGCRRIYMRGNEIGCSCPFQENHVRGDVRPSFSAAIKDDDKSPYLCFGCHERGTLEYLAARSGQFDLIPDWKPSSVTSTSWHVHNVRVGVYTGRKQKAGAVFFREEYLERFSLGSLYGYLKNRGVTKETAIRWELGVDTKNKRAIFVLRDVEGRVGLVVGRDITGKAFAKYSNYVLDAISGELVPYIDHSREQDFRSPTKRFFLYGERESLLSRGKDPRDLIVMEGAIDVLISWQRGYNAVGVLGSSPSEFQIEKMISLVPNGKRLVIAADGDDAGKKLVSEINRAIGRKIPVYCADLPEGKDPASISEEEMDFALNGAKIVGLTS